MTTVFSEATLAMLQNKHWTVDHHTLYPLYNLVLGSHFKSHSGSWQFLSINEKKR